MRSLQKERLGICYGLLAFRWNAILLFDLIHCMSRWLKIPYVVDVIRT